MICLVSCEHQLPVGGPRYWLVTGYLFSGYTINSAYVLRQSRRRPESQPASAAAAAAGPPSTLNTASDVTNTAADDFTTAGDVTTTADDVTADDVRLLGDDHGADEKVRTVRSLPWVTVSRRSRWRVRTQLTDLIIVRRRDDAEQFLDEVDTF